jgi:surface antigen
MSVSVPTPQSAIVEQSVPTPQPAIVEQSVPTPQSVSSTSDDAPYHGKVVATRRDASPTVYNGFYKGFCTYRAAKVRPDIFPYVSENRQDRPFGGNANQWLGNAQRAGLATGDTPAVGAIATFSRGGG